MQVSTIGVDLAKNVFQVHGVDIAGKPNYYRPALNATPWK
jgi:transposase